MRLFVLLIVFYFAGTRCQAQYLYQKEQGREHRPYGFNSIFGGNPIASFELKDIHLYKEKKVKKIFVFSKDSVLLQATELDTSGQIVKEGYYDGRYFQVHTYMGKGSPKGSTTYYLENRLIRTDTFIRIEAEYKKQDTLMWYNRSEQYEYKTGELLNQQNRYYNETYYWKFYRVNRKGSHIIYLNRLRMKRRYMVFLKRKFPTRFDSLKVYPASIGIYSSFGAQKGNMAIDTAQLRAHPFFKSYPHIQKTTYLAPGQSYWEPRYEYDWDRGYSCGGSRYDYDYPSFESRDWTYNAKGLQDSFFSKFYPQDKDSAAVAEYRIQKEKALKNGEILNRNADSYMPRKKTPVVTRIYFVRYEYFN